MSSPWKHPEREREAGNNSLWNTWKSIQKLILGMLQLQTNFNRSLYAFRYPSSNKTKINRKSVVFHLLRQRFLCWAGVSQSNSRLSCDAVYVFIWLMSKTNTILRINHGSRCMLKWAWSTFLWLSFIMPYG